MDESGRLTTDSLMDRIDDCCDRFEAAWKLGGPPDLSSFLTEWKSPEERERAFICLVELDQDYRHRRGLECSIAEYAQRFPEFRELIPQRFAAPGSPSSSPSSPLSEAQRVKESSPDSRYEVQGEIARGGMGLVLRGRDTDLDRELAIKVLLPEHARNPDVIQRFVDEARIGGQLQHPGVAPVYEMGRFADARPYFSMKLVQGETLSALLAARSSVEDQRLRFLSIFKQICETLAYAHSRGVIHRDLKPSNIMVGAFGEVQVMDWGLAKALAASPTSTSADTAQAPLVRVQRGGGSGKTEPLASETLVGSVIGTPAYMPPEQARGEISRVNTQSDVFGLGAILCQILTGKPPYVGPNTRELLRLAENGLLHDCRERLNASGADPELLTLTRDCLAIEISERPLDAGVVAERINGYLTGVESRLRAVEVERAAEAARAEQALHTAAEAEAKARAERAARRWQVGLASTVIGITTIAGIVAVFVALHQENLKREALEAKNQAVAASEAESIERRRALVALADMQTAHGLIAAKQEDHAGAVLWFAASAKQADEAEDARRSADARIRASNWFQRMVLPVAAHQLDAGIQEIAFQASGEHLVLRFDSSLSVWRWRDDFLLPWSAELSQVKSCQLSPDGTLLAIGYPAASPPDDPSRPESQFCGLEIRKFPEGTLVLEQRDIGQVINLQFSSDGRYLATAGRGVYIWDMMEQKFSTVRIRPGPIVHSMVFNRAATCLAIGRADGQLRLHALADSQAEAPLLHTLPHCPALPSPPIFLDDDQTLLTISADGELTRFNVESGEPVEAGVTTVRPKSPSRVVLSTTGGWFAVGGYNGPEIRELATPQVAGDYLSHTNYVADLAFSPQGEWLVTASVDQSSQLWSPKDHRLVAALPHSSSVERCAWTSDGQHFATVQYDGLVRIWRIPRTEHLVKEVAPWGRRARMSSDGSLLAPGLTHESAQADARTGFQRVTILDAHTGEPVGTPIDLSLFLADSCICDENRLLAVLTQKRVSRNGKLGFWDIETGELRGEMVSLPSAAATIAARGPRDTQVAILCASGEVLVFDARTGKQVGSRKLAAPITQADGRLRVEYTPQGNSLVVLTQEELIHVLDADSLEPRFPAIAPVLAGGPCRGFAISADGKMLATAVNGLNAAQVWSLETGAALSRPLPHSGDHYGLFCLCFSPDGKGLLTGSKDGQARYWDWQGGRLAAPAMPHANEIWSIDITPDGRHAVVALRGIPQEVHVWELNTGQPLAPPIRLSNAPGDGQYSHSVVLSRDGGKIYSCDHQGLRILDLASLLAPNDRSIEELTSVAELAAARKIEHGSLSPLTTSQWVQLWKQVNP